MTAKPLRFSDIHAGCEFKMGGPNDLRTFKKLSPRRAVLLGDPDPVPFAVRPSHVVLALAPRPAVYTGMEHVTLTFTAAQAEAIKRVLSARLDSEEPMAPEDHDLVDSALDSVFDADEPEEQIPGTLRNVAAAVLNLAYAVEECGRPASAEVLADASREIRKSADRIDRVIR